MSMHLAHPAFTTTGKKKGKVKWASAEAKAKAMKLDQDWKDLLKRQGIEVEQRKQSRALNAEVWRPEPKSYRGSDQPRIPSRVSDGGSATLAPAKVYTGTKVKGIATMHKSNAVPVFSDEEAVEISTMRR